MKYENNCAVKKRKSDNHPLDELVRVGRWLFLGWAASSGFWCVELLAEEKRTNTVAPVVVEPLPNFLPSASSATPAGSQRFKYSLNPMQSSRRVTPTSETADAQTETNADSAADETVRENERIATAEAAFLADATAASDEPAPIAPPAAMPKPVTPTAPLPAPFAAPNSVMNRLEASRSPAPGSGTTSVRYDDVETKLDQELEQLRREREAIRKGLQSTDSSADRILPHTHAAKTFELQAQLRETLHRLVVGGIAKPKASVLKALQDDSPVPEEDTKPTNLPPLETAIELTKKPIDPIAMGKTAYQAGDYARAIQAFQLVDMNTVPAENRLIIQYLVATSHRKLGRIDDAIKGYEDVMVATTDNELVDKANETLRNFARWQLENLKWQKKVETNLKYMRRLRGDETSDKTQTPPATPDAPPSPLIPEPAAAAPPVTPGK